MKVVIFQALKLKLRNLNLRVCVWGGRKPKESELLAEGGERQGVQQWFCCHKYPAKTLLHSCGKSRACLERERVCYSTSHPGGLAGCPEDIMNPIQLYFTTLIPTSAHRRAPQTPTSSHARLGLPTAPTQRAGQVLEQHFHTEPS